MPEKASTEKNGQPRPAKTTLPSESRRPPGPFLKRIASHSFAFLLGAVLTAWVAVALTPVGDAGTTKAGVAKAAGKQQGPNPTDASAKKGPAEFDPAAEAQRINEINRKNLDRMGQMAGPAPYRPPSAGSPPAAGTPPTPPRMRMPGDR